MHVNKAAQVVLVASPASSSSDSKALFFTRFERRGSLPLPVVLERTGGMRNPIGEDLGGVQESRKTHLARPQPAVGGGSLRAFRRAWT